MSSVQHLKEFISQRLTAAAVEIFGAFEQTIVEYEEELDRQRRLLDAVLKPEIKLHRIAIPDECEEEEVPTHLQISHHVKKNSQDEDDPNLPLIKEEHEEPHSSEEGETLVLKQESDNVMSSAYEDNAAEANGDSQLLSHSSLVTLHVDNSAIVESPTNKKTFICTTCNRSFKGKGALQTHMKTHTEQPPICNTCGKRFRYLSKLKVHESIHTGEKPFLCKTCGKRFRLKNCLEDHVRIHTGEKPFPCKTCGKWFRLKRCLEDHLRIHTGEKPFPCKTCGKWFRLKNSLEDHLRIHTGEKPFPCKICGKRFRTKSHVRSHLRIHTGEKPHACKRCGKHYSTGSILRVHIRRVHTGNTLYRCHICDNGFSESRTLKQHMMVHTGESPVLVQHEDKALQVVKPC
ncbi:zinc finger protein OZF-like [Betta splendens]|uniref:Zinc finger protein OZF-like n=1 Tax=Betta splendens TaxID=158456 RepID=A0A6P7L3W9_BETSP|nr:zinc finger protein OZF-like [Betta splendens]